MKYVCLLYDLNGKGELYSNSVSGARPCRKRIWTDGPFIETREFLAGIYMDEEKKKNIASVVK